MKFTSAVKLSEGSATEYGREEEENFFKRLGKWRSGRRNPSKLHHTEEKDGRTLGFSPLPVYTSATCSVFVPVHVLLCVSGALTVLYHLPCQLCVCVLYLFVHLGGKLSDDTVMTVILSSLSWRFNIEYQDYQLHTSCLSLNYWMCIVFNLNFLNYTKW